MLCDVAPIEACHILLGKPQKIERNVKHHGKTNKISFVHEGHKIKLAPLSPEETSEDQVKLRKKIEDGIKYAIEKETKHREIIEKKSEKERAKDKDKYGYSSFYSDPLFIYEDSLLKGFQKELPCAKFKIPCFTQLFDDVSHAKKENEDEVSMEECKTLILSSNLNDDISFYGNFFMHLTMQSLLF